jgi:hypothetical protein
MLANNIFGDNFDWTATKHGITNSDKNVVETDKATFIGGSNYVA